MTLLDAAQYDLMFGFKYSPRPNTPSLKMEDAIPEEEKNRRLAVYCRRQREIQIARNARMVGKTMEVLVEGKSRRENQWSGHTRELRDIEFHFTSEKELLGKYVQVKVTSGGANSLVGEGGVEKSEFRKLRFRGHRDLNVRNRGKREKE